MNGVHDMGGMHGMGPLHYERDEPVFHTRWEGRVFALNRAMGAWRRWNIDAFRYEIERIPPADYLRKYKGRTPVIHVKDLKPLEKGGKVQFMPLGQGVQNWKEIFAAAHESGVEWFAYEQDSGEGSPFDWARTSFEFLNKNL